MTDDGEVAEPADTGGRWAVARPLLQFTLVGIVAVAIVGIATAAASRRVGQREAIVDARTTTLVKAQTAVEPVVTDGLLDERHDSNQELVGQGLANLVGPLFGCIPVTGAVARSVANVRFGAAMRACVVPLCTRSSPAR